MQFNSFEEFIAMGGYGLYVWSAFAVSIIAMALIVVHTRAQSRRLRSDLLKQQQREEKLKMAKEMEGTL